MILRHRLHCIIVKAKRREGPSGGGAGASSYRPASPAKWEDGHCASEKVRKGEGGGLGEGSSGGKCRDRGGAHHFYVFFSE